MRLNNSEIFNNYIKLAIDAGLVSEDEFQKTAEKKQYGVSELSNAEVLYGHKLGPNFDKSIIEFAHPETAVIAPAYDAMNSIVENEHQRQDISTYVALKTPGGNLTQHRYVKALDELKQSLIRTGFAMDSVNELELMKAADKSAERIASLEKKAIWGSVAFNLALMVLPIVSDALSGLYAKHLSKNTKDPQNTATKLKPQIKAKASRAFGRLGVGIALVTVYNTIKNHFVGSIDIGINEGATRLVSNLSELITQSDFDALVNNYINEVRKIQKANNDFTTYANTLGEVNDVNELAGISREESKPINQFFHAINIFNQKSRNFLLFLDKLSLNSADSITGTEAELFFKKLYKGLTGDNLKKEIENNITSLVSELNDYKQAISLQIQQSVAGTRDAIEHASEQAAEEVVEKDYVQELMEDYSNV